MSEEQFNIEKIKETAKQIRREQYKHLLGLPIQVDPTGMMVPPNGYVVFVGIKVWESLQELTQKTGEAE